MKKTIIIISAVVVIVAGIALALFQGKKVTHNTTNPYLLTAFDKAVIKKFPQWKGYKNYDWSSDSKETKEGREILNRIDSLDFSDINLHELPDEIFECKNLKFLNLLGNTKLHWNVVFYKLQNTKVSSVYVSVYDLSDINRKY